MKNTVFRESAAARSSRYSFGCRLAFYLLSLALLQACSTVQTQEEDWFAMVSPESLTSGEWRIWSASFSNAPEEGYQIEFQTNSSATISALPSVKRWTSTTQGQVLLLSQQRHMLYQLDYDREMRAWVSARRHGFGQAVLVLYPAGDTEPGFWKPISAP